MQVELLCDYRPNDDSFHLKLNEFSWDIPHDEFLVFVNELIEHMPACIDAVAQSHVRHRLEQEFHMSHIWRED